MVEEGVEQDFEDMTVMLLLLFHHAVKEKSSPADDALHAPILYHTLV